MVVAANPEKARTAKDKEEMDQKYMPGQLVMPKIEVRERTAKERHADEQDERLMQEVREMSLREAQGLSSRPPRTRRHRDSRSGDDRSRSSRDPSAEGRSRRTRDGHHRPRMDESGRSSSDHLTLENERRRRHRSESRQRQIEHQSSLRSLISSEDMSERDIEREIEEFARQIQEEGLLDGLDLDNIDLARNDELSRRITEAYRRRQRERPSRRTRENNQSSSNRATTQDSGQNEGRTSQAGESRRSTDGTRPNPHSRSSSATRQEDRSRPPPSMPAGRNATGRPRRRTASGERSSTLPNSPTMHFDTNRAARSQTDLTLRTQGTDFNPPRPPFGENRSSSTPTSGISQPPPQELAGSTPTLSSNASFANRLPQTNPNLVPVPTTPPDTERPTERLSVRTAHRPADLAIIHNTVTAPHASPTGTHHPRVRSPLFPEPSITCSKCSKTHIEYELHYNCSTCKGGEWNICRECYRRGKGCQYWFGFGYGAWNKWEKARRHGDPNLAMPHMLTASRYLPPPTTPGGADGRKTLTNDDPKKRLETGTFCARCSAWTNDCFWRCDVCNEGDWGFCNDCVNQGKSCSHMLLPLTHDGPPQIDSNTGDRPRTPRSPGRPPAATILTGPQASNIGPFKPLTFSTRCDICEVPIPPNDVRYHCYNCTSSLVPDATAGDYDICSTCYGKLVDDRRISSENGYQGWRRCLQGHRMALIGFTDGKVGRWRYIDRDLVGGRALRSEAFDGAENEGQGLQKWGWHREDKKFERVVTKDVAAVAPSSHGSVDFSREFPPDGGCGRRGTASWAWYPQDGVEDELLFPRGADVKEIEDVNSDWFHGTYMGARGLFPAPYVQLVTPQGHGTSSQAEGSAAAPASR